MRYLLVMLATLVVLSPQIMFVSMALLFGGNVQGENARFLALVAATVLVSLLIVASVVTWMNRKDPIIYRYIQGLASASTILSVVGIGVGITLVIGLLTVFSIFFLLSLPVLLLAIWNTKLRHPSTT